MAHRESRDRRTLYCGNLHENVTEEMLFELFLQSGPLESVTMKRDGRRSFGFITFKHEESVPYAEAIMENVCLFSRPLRLAARSSNKDFNSNPNEPYTPEMYVSDSSLHRTTPWHSPQQPPPPPPPLPPQQQQQPLPISLFSNNDMNYPSQPHYPYDDRTPTQRFDRRKQASYHPYNRNEQDYQNMKQRNGNYNQQRRGGGGGGGGYNNYYR
ncbi:unnamed protein product [Rotaria magnacalcarata]|uniref:RRM domain-containing protein n=2 Tax=Rotaria magnacalcarata TaxID=392030 RepID=A0A815W4D4_9BILA|nr:unnamed protein product [Rotaria magnacalcarata]CAF3829325.1 unnamed protein product [Rotaria magnacalcarata]